MGSRGELLPANRVSAATGALKQPVLPAGKDGLFFFNPGFTQ